MKISGSKVLENDLFSLLYRMPKIELHSHIGGSLRASTFHSLALSKKIDTSNIQFSDISIKKGFEIFQLISKLIDSCEVLHRITREIIQDYVNCNCVYLELRSTPKQFQVQGQLQNKQKYLDSVISAIKIEESNNPNIKVRFLISVNRQSPPENVNQVIELLKHFEKQDPGYIVGVELSGDPRFGHFQDFKESFKKIQQMGYKISLHCGEIGDQSDVDQMMDFKPDRLGHCCYLSPSQLTSLQSSKIPLEICPTSNLQTTSTAHLSHFPHLLPLIQNNHNVIVCCDDTLLFDTDLNKEWQILVTHMKLQKQQVQNMLQQSMEAVFDQSQKDILQRKIYEFFQDSNHI